MTVPLTMADLTAIEARNADRINDWRAGHTKDAYWTMMEDVPRLIAEVRRLNMELDNLIADMEEAVLESEGPESGH